MTSEEKAIDYATTECCHSCTSSCDKNKCNMFCNVRNAVLYGLAEGRKEKWHDLREDPNDLPERIPNCNHTRGVLRQDGVKVRYNYYREAWQYFVCDNLLTKCEVIAWTEIPKFEEVKK